MKIITFIIALWSMFAPLEYPPRQHENLPYNFVFKEKVVVFQTNNKARIGYLYRTGTIPYNSTHLVVPPNYGEYFPVWKYGDLKYASETFTMYIPWDDEFEKEALENYHQLK